MDSFQRKSFLIKNVMTLTVFISIVTILPTLFLSYFFTTSFLQNSVGIEELSAFNQKYLLFSVILFFAISLVVFLVLWKRFVRILIPIDQLTYGFQEISSGNFDVKLHIPLSEFGDLCRHFNCISEQLAILADKIVATNEKLDAQGFGEKIQLNNLQDIFNQLDSIMEKSMVYRELQRAEKMNAIGQLAASVAHEIRNPMTVVKGFLQIFLAKEHMSEEERMYIHLMIGEMNRAETIINDYLSLAKPDMERTEKINGKELAEKALDLMNSYAKMSKNIIVITPILENIAVRGNKNELQQVLINILKNGIEALKDGGELSLKLFQEGSYAVFEITDTGIGMTQEEIQRLGTAFYSLKEKGTGMGLIVCYQIIERMRGKIEVKSEKGVGTTFKIYVPASNE